MKNKHFTYKRIPDMTVGMQSQEDCNLQVLHGKVILNEDDKSLLFIQHKERGPRSIELFRTRHSRLVRTPQGNFTLTFRFSPDEDAIQAKLIGEMVDVCKTTENEFTNNNTRKENSDEI